MKIVTDLNGKVDTTFMARIDNKNVYGKITLYKIEEKGQYYIVYLWVDKELLKIIEKNMNEIEIDGIHYNLTSTKINIIEGKEEIVVKLVTDTEY